MNSTICIRPYKIFTSGILLIVCGFWGCEKLDLEPGTFSYPLDLTVTKEQSVSTLHWSEATVSSFEEYIVLRSTDSIPDTPEPELSSSTAIIARIDQRDETTFSDINLLISEQFYYKVYARIAGRLLMSPTVRYDPDLHLLPARTDAALARPDRGELIGVDRANNMLFVYDYRHRVMLRTKFLNPVSSPILRFDESSDEIMLGDNGQLYFFDYNDLSLRDNFLPGYFSDCAFRNGWIYLQTMALPYVCAIYRRSDFSLTDQVDLLRENWRKLAILPDPQQPANAKVYDFAFDKAARYDQNNGTLTVDITLSQLNLGGSLVVAQRPGATDFVISSNGLIVDGNIQAIDRLDDGAVNFNMYAFTPDGSRLFGLAFQNTVVVKEYDASDGYPFMKEIQLTNQVSPSYMFADSESLHLLSIVVVDGVIRTLITSITYE